MTTDLEEIEALAVGAITEPLPFPPSHLFSLPGADFDAELAPVLARVGLAILQGGQASTEDMAALRRLAAGQKPHVREAARRILRALKPRKIVTNAGALAQLAALEGAP